MKNYDYDDLASYYDALEWPAGCEEFNELVNRVLSKHGVRSVLDIACGTGAQAIYLREKNYQVTASDLSKKMLSLAKKKCRGLKVKPGDMRSSKLGKFDSVVSLHNSIGHLSRSDFVKALRNIHANLKPGGLFVFDIMEADCMKANQINYEHLDVVREVNDLMCVRFSKYKVNPNGLMRVNDRVFVQKGSDKPKLIRNNYSLQLYSFKELIMLVEANGFKVAESLDPDNGRRFKKMKSDSVMIVAKRL